MFARIIQLAALLLAACTAQAQWHFTGDSTPTWEQAIARFRRFADTRPGAHLSTIGADDNGLPIHLFVLADGTFPHPDSLRAAGKSILWITNGIHPGEPDGVDASLLLAQALLDSDQYMGLLANTAVCIVPVYNVSGALQRSSTSRANQTGPAEYGFRANARNLDLNRDFIKADSRNTRSLLAALRTWDPDLYFETHVSNGADHQYVMELLTSHPDRLDPALRSYLSTTLKPALHAWMDRRGQLMGPYFETRGQTPEQGLEGFLDGPRYSSGHAALHHRIGILSETHMLKPYADRVNATFQLMLATLAVLNEQGAALRTARAQAREHTRTATHFGFNHRLDTTHVEQLPWKGYRPAPRPALLVACRACSTTTASPPIPWCLGWTASCPPSRLPSPPPTSSPKLGTSSSPGWNWTACRSNACLPILPSPLPPNASPPTPPCRNPSRAATCTAASAPPRTPWCTRPSPAMCAYPWATPPTAWRWRSSNPALRTASSPGASSIPSCSRRNGSATTSSRTSPPTSWPATPRCGKPWKPPKPPIPPWPTMLGASSIGFTSAHPTSNRAIGGCRCSPSGSDQACHLCT
ncbi:MAG: hypothetical protein IPO05_09900 [Flavobacteriales bacterium]|nr:hypothetical protein [Flavobacteriales bacterium]